MRIPIFAIRTKPHGWLLSGTRPSSLILLLDALPPPVIHRVHFFLRNRSMRHFRQTLLSSAWNLYPAQMSQGTEPMSPVLPPETAVPPADSTAKVAPESSLLAVKLGSPDPKGFPNTIELMQAVDFSVRYAIEHTVPLVINLSFGNTYGSHSGTSLLETYLDYVSNLGRINIVVGSGNEGNNGGHASADWLL